MSGDGLHFVSFKPNNGGFTAFLPMEKVLSGQQDSESVMNRAARTYGESVREMRAIIAEVEDLRATRRRVPAKKMWQLGDTVFLLVGELKRLSLELDGAYEQLCRDLKVKRMWLEKVIIFRRYLPHQDAIPDSLNWGQCRDNPRHTAEMLRRGLLPHEES